MKRLLFSTIVILLLLSGCSVSGESNNSNSALDVAEHTSELFAMDTFMSLKAYGENAENAISQSEKEIKILESSFSVTDKNSDIYKINANSGVAVKVSKDTSSLIDYANKISKETNGATDITIYPVLKEWGFTTDEYKVPDNSTLKKLLKKVDYKKITVKDNTVNIPKDYAIDLGSSAKGYTGDKIAKIFKSNGVKSALINLGGNVQAVGTKPDGSYWNIAVKDPIDSNSDFCILSIADKAVITSGSYERYFTDDDGKRYWHILDPSTGKPADNGLISVTVIGTNGTQCDCLSTSLFVMGTEKAVEFAKTHKDIDVILVTDDNKVIITDTLEESIKMLNNREYTVIERG